MYSAYIDIYIISYIFIYVENKSFMCLKYRV